MTSSIAQVLVHLDGSLASADRLRLACSIAEAEGARCTALYAEMPGLLAVPFAAEAGAEAVSALGEIDDARRADARAMFDRAQAGAKARLDWAELQEGPMLAVFARQALVADLLVLGQHDPGNAAPAGVPADFPEAVMAASGRAALVVPCQAAPATVGDNVVIAWKATREAAHAVAAAMPLLQRAREVHVLSWQEGPAGVAGHGLDLDGYLKLRGITPVWHHDADAEPDSLGELLLSRAYDLGGDLLVMGCYGHSRAREWALGGTSRTVLRSMTLPVLMAH